ncbi:hypothetical protein KM043_013482 [Ampulex compressa]|nr:hypothetical protein KM043_013482 [Ampulex compressa]
MDELLPGPSVARPDKGTPTGAGWKLSDLRPFEKWPAVSSEIFKVRVVRGLSMRAARLAAGSPGPEEFGDKGKFRRTLRRRTGRGDAHTWASRRTPSRCREPRTRAAHGRQDESQRVHAEPGSGRRRRRGKAGAPWKYALPIVCKY